jgi:hypothetical protein
MFFIVFVHSPHKAAHIAQGEFSGLLLVQVLPFGLESTLVQRKRIPDVFSCRVSHATRRGHNECARDNGGDKALHGVGLHFAG